MTHNRHHKMGKGGHCICPKCGNRLPHRNSIPCRDERCPDCGAKMLREGSDHHKLFLAKKTKAAQVSEDTVRAFVGVIKKGLESIYDNVFEPFAKARKKSTLYDTLCHMNDRALAELGIARSQIPCVVMNAFEGKTTETIERVCGGVIRIWAPPSKKAPPVGGDNKIAA